MLPKASLGPQTHSKYIGWHYMMIWRQSKKSQKMMIFCDFPPFGPKRWKIKKLSFFAIFYIVFKSSYNVIQCIWNVFGDPEKLLEAFKMIFDRFWATNQKITHKSKISKNPKKSYFWQKFEFFNKPLNDSKWWNLAWNESSWCLRHVLKPYLPSEHA